MVNPDPDEGFTCGWAIPTTEADLRADALDVEVFRYDPEGDAAASCATEVRVWLQGFGWQMYLGSRGSPSSLSPDDGTSPPLPLLLAEADITFDEDASDDIWPLNRRDLTLSQVALKTSAELTFAPEAVREQFSSLQYCYDDTVLTVHGTLRFEANNGAPVAFDLDGLRATGMHEATVRDPLDPAEELTTTCAGPLPTPDRAQR